MPSPKDFVPTGRVVYTLARLLAAQPVDLSMALPPPWGVLCSDLDDLGSIEQRWAFLTRQLGNWGFTKPMQDAITDAIADVPILDGVQDGKPRFAVLPIRELMAKVFEPLPWPIPGLIPVGLTLFAGRPKLGKSLFMLQAGLAVSVGGKVVGSLPSTRGSVLYLDMENGEELLQERGAEALSGEDAPSDFSFVIDSPNLQDGCMACIETWVEDNPNARLVVIDTFEAVRARTEGKGNAYREDYAALRPLADLAKRLKIGIVVVHHTAKRASTNDVFDSISGSFGLNGAVDNLMILGDIAGQIVIAAKGRRVKYTEIPLKFDPEIGQWEVSDGIADQRRSDTQKTIITYLSNHTGAAPKQIAEDTNLPPVVVRQRLFHMCRHQLVENISGKYRLHHAYKVPHFVEPSVVQQEDLILEVDWPELPSTVVEDEDDEPEEMDFVSLVNGTPDEEESVDQATLDAIINTEW